MDDTSRDARQRIARSDGEPSIQDDPNEASELIPQQAMPPVAAPVCAVAVRDQTSPVAPPCIAASTTPRLGMLFPLGERFFIDLATGGVGIGTLSPDANLEVLGGQPTGISATVNSGAAGSALYGLSTGIDGTGIIGEAPSGEDAFGVWGKTQGGKGVVGTASGTSGFNYGGYFETANDSGTALRASGGMFAGTFVASPNTTLGVGVLGRGSSNGGIFTSDSSSGTGVSGSATASSGAGIGVHGSSSASLGAGVIGSASSTAGMTAGVRGSSFSTTGRGVSGVASANTGINYGIYGLTNSPEGYAGYFVGRGYFSNDVGIGVSPSSSARLRVQQDQNTVASFDRQNSDGVVVSIRQDGVQEGTISVSGNTVSYNAFTGSHYAWTEKEIARGSLVRLIGANHHLHGEPQSETVYGITPTTDENDPRVLGAYLGPLEPSLAQSLENPHLVMAVGNGEMCIADSGNGDVHIGDMLISSSIEGCAGKYDPIKFPVGFIVARAAENVEWESIATSNTKKRASVVFTSFVYSAQSESLSQRVRELSDTVDLLQREVRRLGTMVETLGRDR